MPLHASAPHAAAPPPSPAPTQPFNSRPAHGQRPLIGGPNRNTASQHAVHPWAVEFPGTAIHPHPPRLHTTPSLADASREPALGVDISHHLHPTGAHRIHPLYHHLGLRTFNQRLFYFFIFLFPFILGFGFERRHRYQVLRHIWDRKGHTTCTTMSIFFWHRRHMIPRRRRDFLNEGQGRARAAFGRASHAAGPESSRAGRTGFGEQGRLGSHLHQDTAGIRQ